MLYPYDPQCYTRTTPNAIPVRPPMLYPYDPQCYTPTTPDDLPLSPPMLISYDPQFYTRTTPNAIPLRPPMLYPYDPQCYTRTTPNAIPVRPQCYTLMIYRQQIGKKMQTPYIKFINQACSYTCFLVLIMLATSRQGQGSTADDVLLL